jgi:hypothetical protein
MESILDEEKICKHLMLDTNRKIYYCRDNSVSRPCKTKPEIDCPIKTLEPTVSTAWAAQKLLEKQR